MKGMITKTFDDFPVVRAHCQHCWTGKNLGGVEVRESPNTGFWCKKHWNEGPRCSEFGCMEPVMRAKDGGDGIRCRAHIFPDATTDSERAHAIRGTHILAELQYDNLSGLSLSDKESKQATKSMRKIGIPGVSFWNQNLLPREGCGK